MRPKYIASLTLRGFAISPEEVEALVGSAATSKGARGSKRGGGSVLVRSFVKWAMEFEDSARLVEMIPALFTAIGDIDHLAAIRDRVHPEFVEVDIAMWIKDSEEQEGGSIDAATIATLAKLSAVLNFGFYTRADVEPDVPVDGFAAAELIR